MMGSVNLSREQYERLSRKRITAFREIAKALGPKHKITQMMGELSYGRHGAEQGPDGSLRKAIEEFAYLKGYFQCLNLWARDNDADAQRVMLKLMPSGYSGADHE